MIPTGTEHLVSIQGVRGAALLTAQGELVDSSLEKSEGEVLCALVSQLLKDLDEGARLLDQSPARRFLLRAVFGSLLLIREEALIVVLVVQPKQDLEALWPQIENAIQAFPRFRETADKVNP